MFQRFFYRIYLSDDAGVRYARKHVYQYSQCSWTGCDLFFGAKTEEGLQQEGMIYISQPESPKGTIIHVVQLFGFLW